VGLDALNDVARIQRTFLTNKTDFRYATTQSMLREAASRLLTCALGSQSCYANRAVNGGKCEKEVNE
jgi:hypothetical protein